MFAIFKKWLPSYDDASVFFSIFAAHIAFLVGVAIILHHYDATLWVLVQKQDSAEYYSLAQSLLANGRFLLDGFPLPETFRTIGYPAIIALLFALTGGSVYTPGRVAPEFGDSFYLSLGLLALLAALTSVIISHIGRTVGLSRPYAMAAGILFGLSPAVMFLPVSGMGSDMVFAFLIAVSLYTALKLSESSRPVYSTICLGALLGIATLARPIGQYFALLFVCTIPFLLSTGYVPNWKRGMALASITLCSFLLIISPWVARNYVISGQIAISSIPVYSFANYNIPGFLAFYKGTSPAEEERKIRNAIGNPPGILYRSLWYTDQLSDINATFLREYLAPYIFFHTYKTLPFFLGSGIDVSYAVVAIETKWQLHIPFLPHVDENLSNLVYAGDYIAVIKNLFTYWPATLERLVWASVFFLTLLSPFFAKTPHIRKFFIFGILLIGATAFLASPVAQPRYRIPIEPIVWVAALYSLSHLIQKMRAFQFRKASVYSPNE